ncbi:MAG: glycyl-radical enzyme activating protein [Christensenella sp.]|nr:glycyl-radical enzyme activating protein [Christensenella sp.]
MEPKGVIFNIQRYSLHDGNGIRTNIFFKGCPLRCKWCSNPESQKYYPEMSFREEDCMGCDKCYAVCETHALTPRRWDRSLCIGCGKCETVCPTGAREMMGKSMSADEVVKEVIRDRQFYRQSGGGVTFSGGEPLTQDDFAEQLAIRLKENYLHIAVETCGFVEWPKARKVLFHVDQILFDIKHMNAAKHREMTGAGNELILQNAEHAANLGKDMIVRVPVIGGYNADEENIEKTAQFSKKIGIKELHLLPYHRFGEAKYKKMHMVYECDDAYTPDDQTMEHLKNIVSSYGIITRIGG